MEHLLNALNNLPDYRRLINCIEKNQTVGVSGAAQINRSHLIASVLHETKRPALIICQDEMAAVYPKDLIIGYIIDAGYDETGVAKYAKLTPAANFDQLEQVFIITHFTVD